MSCEFNADGDFWGTTNNVPDISAGMSVCFWAYISANPGGNNVAWSCIDGGTGGVAIGKNTVTDQWFMGGFAGSATLDGLTTGEWIFLAMSHSGGAGNLEAYAALETATTWTDSGTTGGSTSTETHMDVGEISSVLGQGFGTGVTGRIMNLKVWDKTKTSEELWAEKHSFRPHDMDSINRWCPFLDGDADGSDWTGTSTDFTENGTVTKSGENPAAAWGYPTFQIHVPTAGSGSTGTAAQTFAAFSQSAVGNQTHVGTAAQSFTAFSQSASGQQTHVGTAAQSFTAFSQSASGQQTHVGTAAQSFDQFSQSATGEVGEPVTGTAAQTFAQFAQSATGEQTHVGTAVQSFDQFSQSVTGLQTHVGTAAQSFGQIVQAALGTTTVIGTGAQTFGQFTQAATGAVGNPSIGTAAQSFAQFSQSASGTTEIPGTADQSFAAIVQAANGVVPSVGTAAQSFGAFHQTAYDVLTEATPQKLQNRRLSVSGFM